MSKKITFPDLLLHLGGLFQNTLSTKISVLVSALLFQFLSLFLFSEEEKPLKIGNLSLPTSQQPGPLFGFGQHVVDKGQVQFFLFADAMAPYQER